MKWGPPRKMGGAPLSYSRMEQYHSVIRYDGEQSEGQLPPEGCRQTCP